MFPQRFHTNQRMSQMVVYADVIYLAGQVADDTSDDTVGQTRQILAKIDRLLAEAGSDKTQIISATIWLADRQHFGAMNTAWDAWVQLGAAPARACVESRLVLPEFAVEISIIAAKGRRTAT